MKQARHVGLKLSAPLRRLLLGVGVMLLAFGVVFYPRIHGYLAAQQRLQAEHKRVLGIQNSREWIALATSDYDIDAASHRMAVTYSPASKVLSGTVVTLGGFMMPMVVSDAQHQFVLSRRSPTCPFCPPGGLNELVEVVPVRAVHYRDELAFFSGRLQLIGNNGNNVFFRLGEAHEIAP